ncbi:MAG: sulfotransferase [Candidatus Hodarchaeota archaeon]
MSKTFYIIGCPRSGTTAVAKILNTATNAEVHVEQEPKRELCIAARNLYKKQLSNPLETIRALKGKQISSASERGLVYGDKNPNYLQFVPYIDAVWNSKFIFVLRDGREVVRSSMASYKHWSGNYYGLEEDGEVSNPVSPEDDWWDYSRLRPNPGHPYYEQWKGLSRFEKCCWNWNEFNSQIIQHTGKLDKKKWALINMNHTTSEYLREIFDFLELEGFSASLVDEMLSSRINSLMEKAGLEHDYPHWDNWSQNKMKIFNKHCGKMMKRFSYYK